MLNIKRLFFILGLLGCFFSSEYSSAQKINQFNKNKERTGVWKKYYPNKRIRYEGEFKDGKEIGIFKFYDVTSSKHPIIIKSYFEGNDSLFVQFFTINGVLRSKGAMNERNREGKWQYYFPDGKVMLEENYENGTLEKEAVTYYPDGRIAEFTTYLNGVKSGVNSKYSSKGILIEEVNFKNGKENGLAKYFDLKGNLKEKGTYKNGNRFGDWEYFINGKLASEKEMKEQKGKYKREN